MISWFRIFVYTIIIVILQVWVFNPVSILRIGTPYIYVVLLMFLPMKSSINKLLFYAFAVGVLIDTLSLTFGLHTSILLPVALFRYYAVRPFIKDQESLAKPPLFTHISYGALILLFALLLLQHILLFFIDSVTLFDWQFLLKRASFSFGLSFFFSVVFMFILSTPLKFKKA